MTLLKPPQTETGNGGLPKIVLNAPDGARAEIYLHGAHVTSWVPAGGEEALFLSPKAEFRAEAAIRGGVPIIFPQFAGMGPLPKHGFARTASWEAVETRPNRAVLRLRETEASLQTWPHKFGLEYTVTIGGGQLSMALKVTNTDASPFDFTAALHTYLQVLDLRRTTVWGLHGLWVTDSADGDRDSIQKEEWIDFPGEVDRIFLKAVKPLQLIQEEQKLIIEQNGFKDAVVWNPGQEKCAALKDMQPDGYLHFVCVEAAAIEKPLKLAPGQSWTGTQKLTV